MCKCKSLTFTFQHETNIIFKYSKYHIMEKPMDIMENPVDIGAWQATVHGVTKVEHND